MGDLFTKLLPSLYSLQICEDLTDTATPRCNFYRVLRTFWDRPQRREPIWRAIPIYMQNKKSTICLSSSTQIFQIFFGAFSIDRQRSLGNGTLKEIFSIFRSAFGGGPKRKYIISRYRQSFYRSKVSAKKKRVKYSAPDLLKV